MSDQARMALALWLALFMFVALALSRCLAVPDETSPPEEPVTDGWAQTITPSPTLPEWKPPKTMPPPIKAAKPQARKADGRGSGHSDIRRYVVQRGDSLQAIAHRFDMRTHRLARLNRIHRAWLIYPGQVLRLDGKITWDGEVQIRPPRGTSPLASPANAPSGRRVALLLQPPHGQLMVPVSPYRISQGYSGPYPAHSGIDLAGPYGDYVHSVAAGKVIGVWWWTYSYGYHVLIQHKGGRTLYAHLAEIWVRPGQTVRRGQHIGLRDSTGKSTGDHLHFEIIKNGVPVNPAPYIWDWGGTGGSASPWDGRGVGPMYPHFLKD